ncbi:MAG: MerR family transcriptional regulator [Thermodesulfobacteriota bacterium]
MKISDLAEEAGLSRHTVHYYLKEGLLPPPVKTGKTMALYSQTHLDCLRFIKGLRAERDMPIVAVRQEVLLRFGDEWEKGGGLVSAQPGSKGEQQRQRIINKALELFSSKGYHRTHISDITDGLHISKGTFYIYFKNKRDVFLAVFLHLTGVLTEIEENLESEPDFFVRMYKRARRYFFTYKKYHRVFDIIRAETIGREELSEYGGRAIYKNLLELLGNDIKKAQENGLIWELPLSPELLGYMVFGAFDFACFRLMQDNRYDLDEFLDTLFQWAKAFAGNH